MYYELIVIFAAYFVGIQVVLKFNLKPIAGAFIAIGIPFIVSAVTRWILLGANLSAIWGGAVTWTSIVTFLVQLILMLLMLRYLKNTDSIVAYFFLGVVGLFIIALSVPSIIGTILQ